MALAVCDKVEHEGAERDGKDDRLSAEAQPDVVTGVDVGEGEAADGGGGLCVEEDEKTGDAVLNVDRVVAEQPARLRPAGLGLDGPRRPVPANSGKLEAREPLGCRPADEVPHLEPVGPAAEPVLEVSLATRCEAEAALAEPVEQSDGGTDLGLHDGGLGVGGLLGLVSLAQPPQQVPDAVAPQQLLLDRVRASCDRGGDPALDADHVLIVCRERSG